MNDYVDKPFVYENYITTETAITSNTDTQPPQPQLQESIIIEERGETGSGTNVFTISDVFTATQCDEIVNYIQKNSALWGERDVGYESGNNVECKFLTLKDIIPRGITGANELDKLIFKRVGTVLNAFRTIRPDFKGIHDDGYTLRRIHGGTRRHVDGIHSKTGGFTKLVRALSFIAVLNDDYDGGIFNFPTQNLKIKVKKGEVIMFPPYWTHPHSVTNVGEGQARYTINTWILEKFMD
jgi:predicted 2-oxoglutarate/Fe(II)-dependent dioxygenase YbiX